MRKILPLLTLSAISVFLLFSCKGGESDDELTFVHMSDTQVGFLDDSEHFAVSDSLLKDAVDAVNCLKPACVIVTGDLLHDRRNEGQRAIYEKRMGEIDPAIPVYVTPGNHDIPKFNEENLAEYLAFVGYDRFSFVKGNCAFIGFDSCRIKDLDAEAEAEQFEWMTGELRKAQKNDHIFLFCHCPIVYKDLDEEVSYNSFPMELRRKYVDLFKEYGVDVLFTGHTHTGIETDLDGLRSVNAGPVAKAFEDRISGINVVKVTKDGVECHFSTGKDVISGDK